MKGQLSAEMLILVAVVLAIVAVVAVQLMSTVEETTGKVDEESDRVLEEIDEFSLGDDGDPCVSDAGCKESLSCVEGICQ